jgi:SH3 domain-containing YSC84-like protein 1
MNARRSPLPLTALALTLGTSAVACGGSPPPPAVSTTETTSAAKAVAPQLTSATQILKEGVADDGRRIPIETAARANCVAVVPQALRNGGLVAGKPANGVVTCRTAWGWSKPGFFVMTPGPAAARGATGGSDLVILASADGAPAAFAGDGGAAPTTFTCYAHGNGSFAGIDLGPVYIKPDTTGQRAYYGRDRRMREVLSESVDVRSEPAAFPTAVASTFNWARAAFFPPDAAAAP